MPKTSAERQKLYRSRRQDGDGEHRLNMWISVTAYYALERLAARYGVTKRRMLERLATEEDGKVLQSMDFDSAEWEAYFTRRR